MKLKSKTSAFAAVLFVAACGSTAISPSGLQSLGSGFVQMFAKEANAEPVNAQDVNIASVSYTTDPFNP